MRTIVWTCAVLVFCDVSRSQSAGSFETCIRDTLGRDSVRFVVEESAFLKLTTQQPLTLVYQTKSGIMVDEKSQFLRFQFLGRKTFTLYPRQDITKDLQPHVFFELTGLATYMSTRVGAGVTSREYGVSVGFALASYRKRTSEEADITYKAKSFEEATSYGGYIHTDREHLSWFGAIYKEKRGVYYRTELAYKIGEIFSIEPLRPFRLFIKSETFLGSGGGLSYHSMNGCMDLSVAYLVPDEDERVRQRRFGNYPGMGFEVSVGVQVF